MFKCKIRDKMGLMLHDALPTETKYVKLDSGTKSGCLQILRNGFPVDFQDIKEIF